MGPIDITFHVEKMHAGEWVHVGAPTLARNYDAFDALGLAAQGEVIAEPRDIPVDATPKTTAAFDLAKMPMAPSWLTLTELLPHRDRLGRVFRDALAVMAVSGPPEDVRAVFWFTV